MRLFRQCKIYCFSFSYHQLLNCINWCNLFSPWHGWKVCSFGVKQQSPTPSLYQSCNYKVYISAFYILYWWYLFWSLYFILSGQ
jgi:hypothetical protein